MGKYKAIWRTLEDELLDLSEHFNKLHEFEELETYKLMYLHQRNLIKSILIKMNNLENKKEVVDNDC
jgi:RecJ-like exonuclease